MARVVFRNIKPNLTAQMIDVYSKLKKLNEPNRIFNDQMKISLGELYKSKFWWPTDKEKKDWYDLWKRTPPEKRLNDSRLIKPWDFLSWIDSLQNAEVEFSNFIINNDGTGELKFEQLSCPCGGLDAIEYFIKIFDGEIISNDAA